jgi:glycosyltransferase involved in cell wall biosynthesis
MSSPFEKEKPGGEELAVNVSLIITTYNWPEGLQITLQSVLRQALIPAEVVVADDGSDPRTAGMVEEVLRPSRLEWRHVWHADQGIRQARIKNLGVRYSSGEYLVFIDHDVVLHPRFIADHLSNAQRGLFLQGKRCFLPAEYTKKLLGHGMGDIPSPRLRGMENRKNSLRIPWLGRILSRPGGFQETLRGCNLSLYRDDFMRVDGYDEMFDQLWGREDSDICYRMFHSGMRVKNLWFSALQYHLHHKVTKRTGEDRLDVELRKIIQEKRKKALKGFSHLSGEGKVIASS